MLRWQAAWFGCIMPPPLWPISCPFRGSNYLQLSCEKWCEKMKIGWSAFGEVACKSIITFFGSKWITVRIFSHPLDPADLWFWLWHVGNSPFKREIFAKFSKKNSGKWIEIFLPNFPIFRFLWTQITVCYVCIICCVYGLLCRVAMS